MPVVYCNQFESVVYGRSAEESALDGRLIKAKKLEEIAAQKNIIAARTRRAPIGAFFLFRAESLARAS